MIDDSCLVSLFYFLTDCIGILYWNDKDELKVFHKAFKSVKKYHVFDLIKDRTRTDVRTPGATMSFPLYSAGNWWVNVDKLQIIVTKKSSEFSDPPGPELGFVARLRTNGRTPCVEIMITYYYGPGGLIVYVWIIYQKRRQKSTGRKSTCITSFKGDMTRIWIFRDIFSVFNSYRGLLLLLSANWNGKHVKKKSFFCKTIFWEGYSGPHKNKRLTNLLIFKLKPLQV